MKKIFYLNLLLLIVSCSTEQKNNIPSRIVGWGDSMMVGAGGDAENIISIVSRELQVEDYYNFGVGGLTSDNVSVLSGGKPFIGFLNSELQLINYNILPFNDQTTSYRDVYIDNIEGRLVKNGNSFFFESFGELPSLNSEKIVKFKDADKNKNSLILIWVGRNDGVNNNTFENIKLMTANNNCFVISICNGRGEVEGTEEFNRIQRINSELKFFYKERFIDLRSHLSDGCNNTICEEFLSNDGIHFNSNGYREAGNFIASHIISNIN
jgi:hypothetical protein